MTLRSIAASGLAALMTACIAPPKHDPHPSDNKGCMTLIKPDGTTETKCPDFKTLER